MRKWKIVTMEPQVNIVEADEIDTHDGMLLFMNEYDGQDEARFHVRRKELVAGYTIANIISFEEVTDAEREKIIKEIADMTQTQHKQGGISENEVH